MTSVAAKHAKGKKLKDVIFVTAGQAQADAKENGRENVVNGTLGAIYDEDGKFQQLTESRAEDRLSGHRPAFGRLRKDTARLIGAWYILCAASLKTFRRPKRFPTPIRCRGPAFLHVSGV